MGKILFASDLDNTLLFSRRHSRLGDVCVELLVGKEQGYFSPLTIARLREVNACMDFVPVTSRSVAQYRRIQFPEGCVPRWAVTTNGGLLLENGEIDAAWQAESLAAVAPWRGELERTEELLGAQTVPHRGRMVDDLYVFAACDDAAGAHALAEALAGRAELEVAVSGRKVYCFPAPINKGHALERLRRRLGPAAVFAAGDTTMDVPMLLGADAAAAPEAALLADFAGQKCLPREGEHFGEFVLRCALAFAGEETQ